MTIARATAIGALMIEDINRALDDLQGQVNALSGALGAVTLYNALTVQGAFRAGGTTDYLNISSTGGLTLAGAATVWDDSMASPGIFRGGVTSLTLDTLVGSIEAYRFDLNDAANITIQFPHQMKVDSAVRPHLHLINKNAIGATNYNTSFTFEWGWVAIGGTLSTTTTTETVTQSWQNAGALTHKMLSFSEVTPVSTQGGISSLFFCRIVRIAAASEPYNTADIFTGGFDIHYEIDSLGSNAPSTK